MKTTLWTAMRAFRLGQLRWRRATLSLSSTIPRPAGLGWRKSGPSAPASITLLANCGGRFLAAPAPCHDGLKLLSLKTPSPPLSFFYERISTAQSWEETFFNQVNGVLSLMSWLIMCRNKWRSILFLKSTDISLSWQNMKKEIWVSQDLGNCW